jgi:hypothetical protein
VLDGGARPGAVNAAPRGTAEREPSARFPSAAELAAAVPRYVVVRLLLIAFAEGRVARRTSTRSAARARRPSGTVSASGAAATDGSVPRGGSSPARCALAHRRTGSVLRPRARPIAYRP